MEIAHTDDARVAHVDVGPMGADWQFLGNAAGSDAIGVRRIRIRPGKQSTPLHGHYGEEEIFYVERGSGWSFQEDGCYEIGPGDVILHPPIGPAHTVVAGDDGIDVLAFGDNVRHEAARFPRINALWMGGMILDFNPVHQFQLEAERAGPVELPETFDPRPATILNVADVEQREFKRGSTDARLRRLSRALGARRTVLNLVELAPGAEPAPPHCHSAVEELFLVTEGGGVLLLGRDEDEHPLRTGSIVSRPAGSGVPHGFRAGEEGMTLFMYSDLDPNDMTFYPRTGKVHMRGLGITFKPELVPFFE